MKYSLILCILIFVALASANYSKRATRKISTCEQLRELRREKVIKQRISLVADIDCKNIPFTPLKILFTKFDGKGHTIKNLNLRYSGKKKNIHQIGLFNSLASGSVVRNVTFVNVSVRGIRNVGIVAGNSHMAVIEHVRVDSNTPRGNTVIGRSNKVGGIIGYAKDSTLTSISVKNTLVKGINKVGGIVGLFTGGQMFNAANLGFRNSSTSIVEGIRSVGGIVGESSASSFIKVGVRRGIIFGQVSVGGISGKSFDTEKADQLYILKYVRLIYRSGAGSEFGGLFGSYIIEGDRNYTISNSYTKARIVAQEQAGGVVGHLNMDTPDAVVFFRNLIVASPIKRAPNSGKLVGSLEFNPNTQTFEMTHVYYFNGINDYLGEIGVVSDSQNHQDPDPNDGSYKKSTVLPTGVGLEYVSIVENAIKYFNQEHIWCQDRLRGEQGFDAKHQICRCGPYSQDYYGACLCSSFTELSENGSFCINSTGVCTTPWHYGKKFVSGYDNIFLEITANDVHFVETGPKKGNLEVKLRYTAQATAWTDIVVLGKKGAFVASLSNYLLGKGFEGEEWKQSLDKTGNECIQQASFSLPWSKVAQLTQVSPFSGDFLLRVYAHTNLLRKEKTIILRDEPHGENAELITAVPILISLNTSVTTSASLSANFTLDFNVDATYYVKSTEIDPSGLSMNVVLFHTVTNPLSLDVEIDSIKVEGNPTSGKIVSSIPINCGPNFNIDNQTIVCQQETTISIDLPVGNDCTDKIVNLQIFFKASCQGPNKNVNSTLCQSVYNQVSANNATTLPASISFDFNFCPHIEDTTLNTKSFKIRQLGHPVKDGHSVKSNHALNSTITLDVIETVVDSSFASAHIEYVYLYEKVPSNDTVSFLDVTIDCSLENGFEVRKDEIQISFSYIPNIYMLSKLLKNWHTGLYFVVVIDVQYEPNGSHQKRNSPFNTQVRLQLPISNTNGHSTERTSSKSSVFVIKEETGGVKRSDSKTDLKDFTLEKAKSISEQYTRESKRNELLMVVLGGSFGITMFIILITLIVVVYNHYKKPKTTVIQLQTEQN